jgi:ribose-phosphate pyrophosphokinase
MSFLLLSGSSNRPLAARVAAELGMSLGECEIEHFPDGELHVVLQEPVRGRDVYLIQSTAPPVAENLLELLMLADACWHSGAARITAVMPYFGYARQDRRTTAGEALGARLVADVLGASGIDQCVVVDLHSAAVEGCFGVPVVQLSAVPTLFERLQSSRRQRRVVVAPDLGAAKLAERYGQALGLPVALIHKKRLTGASVTTEGLVGEVKGAGAIVVDDMISTGGTIEAAVKCLLDAGCSDDISVMATHALLVGDAVERLAALPLRRVLVTDSVARPEGRMLRIEVVSLAPLLAEEIRRMETAPSAVATAGAARARKAPRRRGGGRATSTVQYSSRLGRR